MRLKKGEAAKLAWIGWWVGLSAFVATIADRQVADFQQSVAVRADLVATLGGRDRDVLGRTLSAAQAQDAAYRAAASLVKARLDALPRAEETGWLVTLVHALAAQHGCAVASVDVTVKLAEPKESGLKWLQGHARLKGPYPAVRAWLAGLASAAPGRATGGVPILELTFAHAGESEIEAECRFEVLAR